jgi:hypothetical protein
MDQESVDRNCRAWKDLMDFGWEFCLQVFPQLRPGEDPMTLLREAWERQWADHAAANERLAEWLGRPGGR